MPAAKAEDFGNLGLWGRLRFGALGVHPNTIPNPQIVKPAAFAFGAGIFRRLHRRHLPPPSPPASPAVSLKLKLRRRVAATRVTCRPSKPTDLRSRTSSRRSATASSSSSVVVGLWVLSLMGNCFNFLTLFYICFVLLQTVPVLYEKYEDQVDAFAEKAEAELKKHYVVFNVKVLSKIPKGSLKYKKFA
ncbi:hypothetical protein BUALT_Bualt03G0089900 [Buddleja alternifolia]|uniref:Reticulon-like protein n=1 Tax=Buddleja alternifolia TaxID=168488 RepID=A0AAV6Y314_9LAMI|nr:hypothetical protein BUALT_Bualt03G0089900 [Buddleja alternifolia]